ncbi:HVA22-like protein a [Asimina triloba]
MGSGTAFLKVVAQNFDVLAGYASVKAIESKSPIDDQQWLTYWVLYSLITLTELTFAKVIEWLPFWPYAKLIVTCWLVLPYFSGAAYVYDHFVRPMFVNAQTINIWYVPRKKDAFSKPDDILTAAEKYIEENGSEAFEKLISKTNRGSRSVRSANYSALDEDDHNAHNAYFFRHPTHQATTKHDQESALSRVDVVRVEDYLSVMPAPRQTKSGLASLVDTREAVFLKLSTVSCMRFREIEGLTGVAPGDHLYTD